MIRDKVKRIGGLMETKVLDQEQRRVILNILMDQKRIDEQVLLDIAAGEKIEWENDEVCKSHEKKDRCGMIHCMWNINGKCENNGVDLFNACKNNNFKFYEEHSKKGV